MLTGVVVPLLLPLLNCGDRTRLPENNCEQCFCLVDGCSLNNQAIEVQPRDMLVIMMQDCR